MVSFEPKKLAMLNLALAGDEFQVNRSHNLALIQKQISTLEVDDYMRVAHGVYMLNKLEPFKAANRKTACAWAKLMLPKSSFDIPGLAGLLKHDAKTDVIAEYLKT